MGSYYYIKISNGGYVNDAFSKAQKSCARPMTIKDHSIKATALPNVKFVEKRNEGNHFFNKYSYEYDDFPIICEKGENNVLVDVITGKSYQVGYNVMSPNLVFGIVESIDNAELVKLLKPLTDKDVERYGQAMQKLEDAIAIAYKEEMAKKSAEDKKAKSDAQFIREFRKKYNKN